MSIQLDPRYQIEAYNSIKESSERTKRRKDHIYKMLTELKNS